MYTNLSPSLSLHRPHGTVVSGLFDFLRPVQSPTMAARTLSDSPKSHPSTDTISIADYPVPLSPPLPSVSKGIELSRAMSASSRSALFSLSRTDVLFEDHWLLAVNKPPGVYCESVLSSAHALLGVPHDSELHLANRLDRDTSGVMILTKLNKVAAKLVKAFTSHRVKKTYIASCVGQGPYWEKLTIKSGHGRSKFGAWRVYALTDVGRTLPGGSLVRDMETQFEVLSINGEGKIKELSRLENQEENIMVVQDKSATDVDVSKDEILVRAYPRSGRTHQIRLHCQYLGIPIRGDVKYEGVHEWKGRVYDGHELYAESLSLEHPVTGEPLVIQAPLPSWACQILHPLSLVGGHT